MSIQRRQLIAFIGQAIPLLCASTSWAQNTKPNATASAPLSLQMTIHKVTRLSVLTDRLGRGHAQRVLNVLPTRAAKTLVDSSAEAKKLLLEVSTGTYQTASKSLVTKVVLDYDTLLSTSDNFTSNNKLDLTKFCRQADDLSEEVDKLVDLLIKDLGKPMTKVLSSVADLQRLSQHLAVHFLLARAGIEEQQQQKLLSDGINEFNSHLKELQTSTVKSPQIESEIQLIGNQWFLMHQALKATAVKTPAEMEHVCTTSERTLDVLNEIYVHYELALK